MTGRLAALAVSAFLVAAPVALAQSLPPPPGGGLGLPLDCDFATTCSIQNYVDMKPGPEAADWTCGHHAYNGDRGADFRLPDEETMLRGVAVVAVAAGTVRAVRDVVRDIAVSHPAAPDVAGREAGNAVVLTHENGWEMQYSHMRQGSVAVKQGDRVTAGQKLGLVGLSGRPEFTHVELQVRHNGVVIDPFSGRADDGGCGGCGGAAAPLWTAAAAAAMPYREVVALCIGFAINAPSQELMDRACPRAAQIERTAKSLILFASLSGPAGGDRGRILITAPDGSVVVDHT
ncbi:MAG: M23 family metallopeptidase [Alphaproteobacteria bacterium]|nr:M23 family metallopeptidase [Alphaproteobacteria bacterium]